MADSMRIGVFESHLHNGFGSLVLEDQNDPLPLFAAIPGIGFTAISLFSTVGINTHILIFPLINTPNECINIGIEERSWIYVK